MALKPHKGYFQAAWVVDDLDAAMGQWLANGTGPFFVFRHAVVTDFQYRGSPSFVDFSVGLAQAGSIQIELIQQHDDRPSHYRDAFGPGQSGFHHMCRLTSDFESDLAELVQAGNAVAAQGLSGDMHFAYVDTRHTLGHMTELIENVASINELFDMVRQGACNWDGKDPVREIA